MQNAREIKDELDVLFTRKQKILDLSAEVEKCNKHVEEAKEQLKEAEQQFEDSCAKMNEYLNKHHTTIDEIEEKIIVKGECLLKQTRSTLREKGLLDHLVWYVFDENGKDCKNLRSFLDYDTNQKWLDTLKKVVNPAEGELNWAEHDFVQFIQHFGPRRALGMLYTYVDADAKVNTVFYPCIAASQYRMLVYTATSSIQSALIKDTSLFNRLVLFWRFVFSFLNNGIHVSNIKNVHRYDDNDRVLTIGDTPFFVKTYRDDLECLTSGFFDIKDEPTYVKRININDYSNVDDKLVEYLREYLVTGKLWTLRDTLSPHDKPDELIEHGYGNLFKFAESRDALSSDDIDWAIANNSLIINGKIITSRAKAMRKLSMSHTDKFVCAIPKYIIFTEKLPNKKGE